MKIRKRLPNFLHPFLFTLYPILQIYAANLGKTTFASVQRSLVAFILLAGLVFIIARLVLRSWQRGALITSLAMMMFFSFGHVQDFLWRNYSQMDWLFGARPFFFLWLLGFTALGMLIVFRLHNTSILTQLLNLTGVLLLLMVAITFTSYAVKEARRAPEARQQGLVRKEQAQGLFSSLSTAGNRPDLYYIILDGYGQAKMLQDLYELDNSQFIDFLKSRGFYVAEDSHANYMRTALSLSSSLNMDYLEELIEMDPSSSDYNELAQLIRYNQVAHFLKLHGYRTIAVTSGFELTDMMAVDERIGPRYKLNNFEWQLLNTTMLGWATIRYQEAMHRYEFHERFRLAAEAASEVGPKFVFVHIIAPHPPFVFDRNGGAVHPERMTMADGSSDLGMHPGDYIARYGEQLFYVNRMMEEMIDEILARSKTPPIIIVQGDHGPGAYLNWLSWENTCLRERFSILNAYFLPGVQVSIPPDITPVNSFRIVLDAYFGAGYGRIEQRSYFAGYDYPYRLDEVTEWIETCAPLK